MRIVVNIDAEAVGGPRAVAAIARGFLKGVILQNRILIRAGGVPPIYEVFTRGDVLFQAEPWAGRFEEFACARTVLERGWGDCDDLVAWRCAELQEQGVDAQPKIYWRMRDGQGRPIRDERAWRQAEFIGYHAEVRLPCACHGSRKCPNGDAPVEDVSTFLGMARRATLNERGPKRRRRTA